MTAETTLWTLKNFSDAFATDSRRKNRILKIAEAFARNPGKSIPQMLLKQYDIKATYELFKHRESTPMNLQRGHRELTHRRMSSEPGNYLLIEDSSDFIFKNRVQIKGFGPMGDFQDNLQGFMLHSVLVAKYPSIKRQQVGKRLPVEIIGLIDQQYYLREPISKPYKSRQFETRKRETDLWLNSQENIGKAVKNENIKWVRVADRGADIYEFMRYSIDNNYDFVVRARHNRNLESNKRLFEYALSLPIKGELELNLRSRPEKEARKTVLSLRYGKVSLPAPKRPGVKDLKPIECNVISVREENPIEGEERLEWFLLTNRSLDSIEDAYEVVEWYASRWIIEDYHKALKSGMKAEDLQIEDGEGLFAAISIMAIVALRLLDIRERIRLLSDESSLESGLDEIELLTLEHLLKRKIRTVREVGLAIGRLGGHMGRKNDGPPGMITLWRGYSRLKDTADGVRIGLEKKITQTR